MNTNGALPLTAVRARAAKALEPETDQDPVVLFDYPDAAQPPALILVWENPWLTPLTIGSCLYDARLAVLCVVARVDPAISELERLVTHVISRLEADGYSWPNATVQAPVWLRIADIPLLGARVVYELKVTTETMEEVP